MGLLHTYDALVEWSAPGAEGTRSYTSYSRDHEVRFEGKAPLPGSADPAFRGDASRYNPEQLLVGALSQCHMLWFLHLASADGVVVVGYIDNAQGTMRVEGAGHGQFTGVRLHPLVTLESATREDGRPITDGDLEALHARAHEHCFIARSVSFPVTIDPPGLRVAQEAATAT
ncbi:OsmC family protein [Cellulomonas bogoriensis]|uniref:Peroxiredoxin n=1 Tax=Cellulomonas bogoriensis 69B4 = DSM 16987 TaxID=1386082 RepID=A0A0A0C378_9CELL|nr:OsmC family protein [Cellulomonas bogoriensis]KGM14482.1 peroxiredoxin [Cellulomonas bogoriensis 69B4 = DSM 16987]